jgi:hypothetical protein
VLREHAVADGVDAAVERVEPAHGEAVLDCTPPEPELRQLPAGDDTVLPGGEGGDRRVGAARPTFTPYFVVKVERARHGSDRDGRIVSPRPRIVAPL